ncbi:MAG: 2-C-methyl-D-erythritol 4-phosphate cytidylyltransferase [Bacteroidales bacterium]|nr:2-C-methyl-D-erythritol 4-phosphate cytidylyltransferase [Bacteroidales bacterium]
MNKYVIIVAGGKGLRMGGPLPKQFLNLAGKPIIMHTIERFVNAIGDISVILVLSEETKVLWQELVKEYDFNINVTIADGGETRFDSVKNGLKLVDDNSIVAVHDAVRPFVSKDVIIDSFNSVKKNVGIIPVVEPVDSVREIKEDESRSIDRSKLRLVQTPQVFFSNDIKCAYNRDYENFFTDDASVFEAWDGKIVCIDGNRENIKITTPFDLKIAEILIENA